MEFIRFRRKPLRSEENPYFIKKNEAVPFWTASTMNTYANALTPLIKIKGIAWQIYKTGKPLSSAVSSRQVAKHLPGFISWFYLCTCQDPDNYRDYLSGGGFKWGDSEGE
jgi:hypothetical protein